MMLICLLMREMKNELQLMIQSSQSRNIASISPDTGWTDDDEYTDVSIDLRRFTTKMRFFNEENLRFLSLALGGPLALDLALALGFALNSCGEVAGTRFMA
jgi:hypothetical protein